MEQYPKRLIEVDLPIKRISAHARREKSIRHGHISTLHIWWARRPLAACRAVICASLWPDPADALCPDAFRKKAETLMREWAEKHTKLLTSPESLNRFIQIQKNPEKLKDYVFLRQALLDFIADFANWDNSTVKEYLDTSRALTQSAHEALGGAPGTRPLVVDPFAGGGSIPLEALRVGADAFASDLNPVAVLLNKVVIEYIPKYGKQLADEVRKWGKWVKEEAEKELDKLYPKDSDGATPIAYLWARTIKCEGPGCGAEVPLIRSLWLAKKTNRSLALQLVPNPGAKRIDFQIIVKQRDGWIDQANTKVKIQNPKFDGTVKRGSATCPCCGYTTPVSRVREYFRARRGGANDARLMCVVTKRTREQGRFYRLPIKADLNAIREASVELNRQKQSQRGTLSLVPDESLPPQGTLGFRVQLYGMLEWGDLFTARQALAMSVLAHLVKEATKQPNFAQQDEFARAVQTILALSVDRVAAQFSSLSWWQSNGEFCVGTFGRQALPIVWDFCEIQPVQGGSGDLDGAIDWVSKVVEQEAKAAFLGNGQVVRSSATSHPLPDDSASGFISDPPYYDAVPYADLSDYFYVWLRRLLPIFELENALTPKEGECIVDKQSGKDRDYFETTMRLAMTEARRVLAPKGICIVVFAHKSTSGWEAQIQAMIDAGWILTGSWPIDTERAVRMRANDSAALASSVHLVCRPREHSGGSMRGDEIGDWRDVLQELPQRIRDWMPRLAEEGVVGADAIFACLGPALEIFSRYSRVEKASGEIVTLKEYLEQVWAAVAKEALNMIFTGADATGFEEDSRLTAMWLWTLKTGDANDLEGEDTEDNSADDEEGGGKKAVKGGFALEYDAARKIAQGLGAHLQALHHLVTVQGDTAILLPVAARTRYLFGKDTAEAPKGNRKKKDFQMKLDFGEELKQIEQESGPWSAELKGAAGRTILDQLHQSMIFFAAGRTEALRRFLVEEGIGRKTLFWRLAQALSALYPTGTDEKRWVDGVLARKKGLGF